ADLALSGNVTWVGGWGINIGAGGKAQASTSASSKFASMIQGSGEYSIEAWVAPANVTQTNAYVVSYSGSNTTRDMTLGQAVMQYEGLTRSSATDTNGMPPLMTSTTGGAAQAALQHVVLTYDPVNGQKFYINGMYTGDADPAKGGTFANWDNTFALVLGNETTGQRQWQGVIKFVAIHNRALTLAQIQQNFAAGVGEKYFLLFGVSSLSGVSKSYIVFQASQYDSYSYLFYQPKFVSLDPNAAAPVNLKISGMRLGVNGSLAPAGQSYATMNATVGGGNYTAANGQLLSGLGTVVPATLGPANDLFFLAFDQFGSHVHPYVEPVVTIAPPTPDNSARADFGVATFERAFHSMARVTGVPITNPTVMSLYMSEQQSLPSTPDIAAFLPSHQTAISQLASAFCSQLVTNQAYRDAFFGTGLDAAINSGGAAFFGPSGSANRALVVNTLASKIFGANVLPSAQLAAQAEANALLTRIPTLQGYGNATVGTETTAVCTAVLGSAALSLQ
ncbi:MAG: LamG domain-containing protein, partial [Gammaproteobacteria bacterium]|nr:LamG domain-containing protein [Gammaproteobacteria bacterium]